MTNESCVCGDLIRTHLVKFPEYILVVIALGHLDNSVVGSIVFSVTFVSEEVGSTLSATKTNYTKVVCFKD